MFAPLRRSPGAPAARINLFSDTQTRPTPAMKAAMVAAEVGDEQHGDDPTVDALCDRVAALLGKEAAMFLPSGTMCNQIALLTHCRPGDEAVAHESAHIVCSEGGGGAALAGVTMLGLRGARGMFDADAVRGSLRDGRRYSPPQTLLAVEQTTNFGGGAVWPVAALDAVSLAARAAGMATHMDGARLMNAVVASGESAARHASGFDSAWIDFTKGLGAPLGAALAGSAAFIGAAWRWKQRLGGAMRQAGICAAACLHALDNHVDRLAEDHASAAQLARGLAAIPGISVSEPDTNLVFFDTAGTGWDAAALAERAAGAGLWFSVFGPTRARACTHLDVSAGAVDEAVDIIAGLVRGG